MRLLLDTQILLWSAATPDRLSAATAARLQDPDNALVFSVVSLWEIVLKSALGRDDFRADARLLRRGLLDNGYEELPVTGPHALAVANLPPLHRDPFDRMLLAQAMTEGMLLITADPAVAQYEGPVSLV